MEVTVKISGPSRDCETPILADLCLHLYYKHAAAAVLTVWE